MDRQTLLRLKKLANSTIGSDKEICRSLVQKSKKEIYDSLLQELPKPDSDKCKSYFEKYKKNPERYWSDFYLDFIKRL